MKVCTKCLREQPLDEFHSVLRRGKAYTYPYCKQCHRGYTRQHYRDNKQTYVERATIRTARVRTEYRARLGDYLRAHPCVDCGESDIVVLQFDHVRGVKTANVSQLFRVLASWDTIMAEIAKCDVRCANCHFRRTAASRGWWSMPL